MNPKLDRAVLVDLVRVVRILEEYLYEWDSPVPDPVYKRTLRDRMKAILTPLLKKV